MNRRSFLFGTAAAITAAPMARAAATFGMRNNVSCVVVHDVTPESSIAHQLALFDAFSERGLPFTCVVRPEDAEGRAMRGQDRLAALLAGYTLQGRGIDVAGYVPDISARSEYFQGRLIRDAHATLRASLSGNRAPRDAQTLLQVAACDDIAKPKSPSGVRSAGVKTLLAIPTNDKPVTSELWPNGVVRLYGGTRVALGRYRAGGLRFQPEATQSLFYISAADLEAHSPSRVADGAVAFAGDLLASENTGRNSVQRAADLQLRDSYGFQRSIAVHLTRPARGDAALMQGFDQILTDLTEQGIFASVGDQAGVFAPERKADYWLPQATGAESDPLLPVTRACLGGIVRAPFAPDRALPAGHSLAFGDAATAVPGFDECAVLWLPSFEVATSDTAATLSDHVGRTNDLVISIRAEAMVQPFARNALINQLKLLASDGITRFVPLHVLGQMMMPQGAEIERQRRTQAAMPDTTTRRPRRSDSHRAALMEDARIAWSYIERNTNRTTGLCPATVNSALAGGEGHAAVTMWDVGSHINGLVAAAQLGLISEREFKQRIAKILPQIRGRKSQGRLLPQGWLRVDRNKWGTKDFDGSDAGRLLASLENLRRYAGMEDRLSALVNSWDLDKIVVDGEVHSVTDGEMTSVYRSHSAHYSVRAFRAWGVDVKSPYEVFQGRSDYDDQMALLEASAWIGPIGAEPLLLEAMELGMSRESAYLAEVLFAAQVEEHAETGRLIAVSEGPIDVSPWFTYQGLQLDATERTWALDTVGYEPQYADPDFWRDNLVISSKAAFLWAAYRPHDYSHKLLDYVREKSRFEGGFASSIFSKTGRVTKGYSDLNTNGVILQAVAHAMAAA